MNYFIDESCLGQVINNEIITSASFDKPTKDDYIIKIGLSDNNDIELFKATIFKFNLTNKYIGILNHDMHNRFFNSDIYFDSSYRIYRLISNKARFLSLIGYDDIEKLHESGIYPIRILIYAKQ